MNLAERFSFIAATGNNTVQSAMDIFNVSLRKDQKEVKAILKKGSCGYNLYVFSALKPGAP